MKMKMKTTAITKNHMKMNPPRYVLFTNSFHIFRKQHVVGVEKMREKNPKNSNEENTSKSKNMRLCGTINFPVALEFIRHILQWI